MSAADFVKTQQHIARGDRTTLDLLPFLTSDDDDLVARVCDALLWHARRPPWPLWLSLLAWLPLGSLSTA